MYFPDLESIQAYLERLSARNQEVAIGFVLVELMTGLSSCRQLRDRKIMSQRKKTWHLDHAKRALEVAESRMWKLKIAHPEFDQMMALAERLRFELDAIETE